MSIAGLDPGGGAGLLADIKTFESHRVYGFGVCSALTVQTATEFFSVEWLPPADILMQAAPLLQQHAVSYCKIGIVEDVNTLLFLLRGLQTLSPGIRIILDPVLKASAGFSFHDHVQRELWQEAFSLIYLLTPNYQEAMLLTGETSGEQAAKALATYCHVLLKGGHHPEKTGYDTLFLHKEDAAVITFPPGNSSVSPKHGSGCVFSAAVTAALALGFPVETACANAKAYTEKFLSSHSSLTGYHL